MTGLFPLLYATMAGCVALSVAMAWLAGNLRSPPARAFGLFALGTFVWNLAYAVMFLSQREETVRLVYRISSIAWGANPSLALYYAYRMVGEYTAGRFSRRIAALIFAPVPVIWYGVFSGRMLAVGFDRGEYGWIERIDPSSPWNYVFIAIMLAGMAAFALLGARLLRLSRTNRARLHARLITIPVSVMILLVIVFHILLPLLGKATFPPTVQMLLALWLIVVAALLYRFPVFSISPTIAADKIVNSMSDLCFLVGVDGTIRAANPATRDLLGYEPATLLGRPSTDILPSEPGAILEGAPLGGEGRSGETFLRTADGSALPCVVRVNAIRDSLDDPVGFVVIAHELREVRRLRRLSETDDLTGEANRRKMEVDIAEAIAGLRRHGRPFAAIMMDIDDFKSVNDRFGHDAGDAVLKEVCAVSARSIREADLFARWGGEEFLILSSGASEEEAWNLAERVRVAIAGQPMSHGERVSASFGVSAALPEDTLESLVKRADQALYRSKLAGKNRVTSHSAAAGPR